jgi:hypothetical protein
VSDKPSYEEEEEEEEEEEPDWIDSRMNHNKMSHNLTPHYPINSK